MHRDPALGTLQTELQRLGFVVVPHGDHICVRLPLLASVRIRMAEGALRLQPLFGPLRRSRALMAGVLGVPAALAALFGTLGAGPVSIAATAAGGAYLLADVYRLIITESCIGRLQLLWAALGHADEPPLPLDAPPTRPLEPPPTPHIVLPKARGVH